MRVSFKEKGRSQNKENRGDDILYSFSKNLKSHLNQKASKKSNNFVQQVNGYIESISPYQKASRIDNRIDSRNDTRQNKSLISNKTKRYNKESAVIREKKFNEMSQNLKKQKLMNKNLQKCIIEIQKILWQRQERLDQLQQQFKNTDKFLQKNSYQQQQQAITNSCRRIRQSKKQLRRQAQTFDVKQIISKMSLESDQNAQLDQNSPLETESSDSYEKEPIYTKVRRPRTESQIEGFSSKRLK